MESNESPSRLAAVLRRRAASYPLQATRRPTRVAIPRSRRTWLHLGLIFLALSRTAVLAEPPGSSTLAGAFDGGTIVGLKAASEAHGMHKGEILLDAAQREQAIGAVLAVRGVTLTSVDDLLPVITVEVDAPETLAAVRSLPVVEYAEPRRSRDFHLEAEIACEHLAWGSKPVPYTLDQMRMSGPYADVMPWNYLNNRVSDAWVRSAGDNVKVAVIDSGTFQTQTQLQPPLFSSPASLGIDRNVAFEFWYGESPWSTCSHGTRAATTIAAPHDGANIIGVAWKADLLAVRALESVFISDGTDEENVAQAIRTASANGAKIVAMAIGRLTDSPRIAQEILYSYYNRDVLFIAAAGTIGCTAGVVFPARMEEVLAVAGINPDGTRHESSCEGPEVDLGVVIGEVPAAGAGPADIIHFGGTSAAASVAAGVAALVWSAHPEWSRDQVRQRLLSTAAPNSPNLGGRINAYRAVGGFDGLSIAGPLTIGAFQPYQLTAKPIGEGPFTYRWQPGGQTTASISATSGASGTSQTFTLTVTDLTENKQLSSTRTVTAASPTCPTGQKCCEVAPDNTCSLCVPTRASCP